MAIKQDVELKGIVSTTVVPLRILTDDKGELMYQEQQGDGADLLRPQDGIRFIDKFDTWHLGGFIKKYVTNGWYDTSSNVNCMDVGEIKPSSRRLTYRNINVTGTLEQYGIASLNYDVLTDTVLAAVRYEESSGDNVPNRLRIFGLKGTDLTDDGAGYGANFELSAAKLGDKVGTTTGFTNKAGAVFAKDSTNIYLMQPMGTEFKGHRFGATSAAVALPAHAFAISQGRIFKVDIDAKGRIGLANCDINADPFSAGNWTTPVILGALDGLSTNRPSGVSLNTLNGVPIVGTPDGIYVLGPGGIPENMTPQFHILPAGAGNMSTMVGGLGGIIVGMEGRGELLWFSTGGGARIGPNQNPLAIPDRIRIMDIIESPTGDLWVLGFRFDLSAGEDIVIWVGKKQPGVATGPGSYAWHPFIQLSGNDELANATGNILGGSGRIGGDTVMMPYIHPTSGKRYLLVGGGSTGDETVLVRLDGNAFFGLTPESEDIGTASINMPCEMTTGRYSRRSRNQCFFSRIHFRGHNFGTGSAVRGGTVTVEISTDGGSFANAGTLTNTTNGNPFEQIISISQVAFDLNIKLKWNRDGSLSTMNSAPATVTQIEIEGKEIPDKVRVITMVVEAVAPRQAGGVRSHKLATTLRDQLEALSFSATERLSFSDPHNDTRTTVYLADNTVLSAAEAARLSVPEGSLQLTLVEVL